MSHSTLLGWRWTPVVLYMAFIFGLSSITTTPDLAGGRDKALHALLYAGLAVCLMRAWSWCWRRPLTLTDVGATIVTAVLYAVTDEVHQHFVPPRQADVMDALADAVGAATAATAVYVASLILRGPRGSAQA